MLAIEVLEHVPGPDAALDELARVCSGTLVASVPFEPDLAGRQPGPPALRAGLGQHAGHVNHWTRWGFRRFVAERFDVEQVRSPLPWTMVQASAR